MKLLDQQEVAEKKNREGEELGESIRKLREEEIALTKRINDALAEERIEIEASKSRTESFKGSQAELELALGKEVRELEKRKRDALQPIIEREKALIEKEGIISKTRADLEDQKTSLGLASLTLRLTKEDYESKLKFLDSRDASLSAREAKLREDVSDSERNANARLSRVNDEYNRLREYFEKEDEKLKQKQKNG